MAPLIVPSPDVRYRIQNVDFRTYLDLHSLGEVGMRRFKESPQQQWFFRKISDGIFEIVNAEDKEYMLEASAAGSGFNLTAQKVSPGTPQRLQWKLVASRRGSFYILNSNYRSNDIFLHLENDKDSTPKLTRDSSLTPTTTTISKEASYRWNIAEDSPATLPDGTDGTETYVIQTLGGEALQSASPAADTTKIYLGGSNLGPEHIWEIVDLGNGKGTIRNTRADAFVNVQQVGSAGEWTHFLSKTTPVAQWDIRKVGALAFSLTIERPVNTTRTRLALTALNGVIVLKPNKDVQNQMWSIVPTDLASFNPLIIANPMVNLPVGMYALQSENGFYLRVDESTKSPNIYIDKSALSYFKFELAKGNDGTGLGHVYISHDSVSPRGYFCGREFLQTSMKFYIPYMDYTGYNKEAWRVELVSTAPPRYSITHVWSAEVLDAYNDGGPGSTVQLGKPTFFPGSNRWSFIPKQ
ncbi:hypothetical protein GALMADRAFT_251789 [Galerina marginata CBS 339.88]|uniref:Uncharacterized protein n=1 Tax=Galerina marginata (strain CBS 339.88) TaxID=685588 RepID=A0A067SQG3_GALM3|nr:hypothetical protein GALMADRAFT_251789 [Galerina marginata CBS 339.88]